LSVMPIAAVRTLARPHPAALPVSLYLMFAAADLVFSLFAFSHGVAEGNPVMAWLLAEGLFIPGKIAISLVVAALMLVVYNASRRWWWAIWGSVVLMGAVVVYHAWAIPQLGGVV